MGRFLVSRPGPGTDRQSSNPNAMNPRASVVRAYHLRAEKLLGLLQRDEASVVAAKTSEPRPALYAPFIKGSLLYTKLCEVAARRLWRSTDELGARLQARSQSGAASRGVKRVRTVALSVCCQREAKLNAQLVKLFRAHKVLVLEKLLAEVKSLVMGLVPGSSLWSRLQKIISALDPETKEIVAANKLADFHWWYRHTAETLTLAICLAVCATTGKREHLRPGALLKDAERLFGELVDEVVASFPKGESTSERTDGEFTS